MNPGIFLVVLDLTGKLVPGVEVSKTVLVFEVLIDELYQQPVTFFERLLENRLTPAAQRRLADQGLFGPWQMLRYLGLDPKSDLRYPLQREVSIQLLSSEHLSWVLS